MGRDAKFIVTGDATQIDLPNKADSGLIRGMNLLKGIRGIATIAALYKHLRANETVLDS